MQILWSSYENLSFVGSKIQEKLGVVRNRRQKNRNDSSLTYTGEIKPLPVPQLHWEVYKMGQYIIYCPILYRISGTASF